jgi:hypothetical protein
VVCAALVFALTMGIRQPFAGSLLALTLFIGVLGAGGAGIAGPAIRSPALGGRLVARADRAVQHRR